MPHVYTLEENYEDIADAIREKLGVQTTYKPGEMAAAISSISGGGGGDNNWSAVMQGDTTALYDNDITSLRPYGLICNISSGAKIITSISFPNVTELGTNAFGYQENVTTVYLPKVATIGDSIFSNCRSLIDVKLPSLAATSSSNKCSSGVFGTCTNIEKIDLGNNSTSFDGTFYTSVFSSTYMLKALILRWNAVVACGSNNTLNNSGISAGTTYIYVPKSLVTSYQSTNRWSTYANQFRAIEDYSTDGTVWGGHKCLRWAHYERSNNHRNHPNNRHG